MLVLDLHAPALLVRKHQRTEMKLLVLFLDPRWVVGSWAWPMIHPALHAVHLCADESDF
jgi:hypothetical protein